MKSNVSVVRLIVATRSSGPSASGKIIKEMPGSVASGTFYIKNQQDASLAVLFISHCKITLHVSDAFCVNHQDYLGLNKL